MAYPLLSQVYKQDAHIGWYLSFWCPNKPHALRLYPDNCVRSNILFTATGLPLAGWATSADLFSFIFISNAIKMAGVTTLSSLSSPPSIGVSPPLPLFRLPLLLVPDNVRFDPVPAVPGVYGDAVCAGKEFFAVSALPSSLYRSHSAYRDMISCAIVAISGMDTFNSAKKPTIS
jgi:hypothetical protein